MSLWEKEDLTKNIYKMQERDRETNMRREEKGGMKAVEEVIVSHAWREKVETLIKK